MCFSKCGQCAAELNQREAETRECPPKPNFAEAAREEAGTRWPSYPAVGFSGADDRQAAFREGAEWARTYLAAQEPQVAIRCEEGKPATCEVRQDGVLVFSGRDHSADLQVAAKEPTDAEVGALQMCLYDRTLTWVPTMEARTALSAARRARGGTK